MVSRWGTSRAFYQKVQLAGQGYAVYNHAAGYVRYIKLLGVVPAQYVLRLPKMVV
jgi:hypothetical protein